MPAGDEPRALSDDGWEPDNSDEWDEDDEHWDEDGGTSGSAATGPGPELFGAGFLPRDPGLDPPDLICGPGGGFAGGGVFDAAPPGSTLAGFAEEVTGPSGWCAGTSDDELVGVLRAWGRLESWAAERKLAVIAELIRRRPALGDPPSGPGGMPAGWGKFCGDELAAATAVSGQAAEKTLRLAHDLAARLPGTATALREGVIDAYKARIIAELTRVLTVEEAAAAEAVILAKVAGKTPGQVRVITARAVASVNPAAAQARRERAQRDARVELWREDAGTAALCGRDLPPAEALAADQRISACARDLKAAGLDGTMDQLRARAFLDLALGICSRPVSPLRHGHDVGARHGTPAGQPAQQPPAEGSPAGDSPAGDSPAGNDLAEGSSAGGSPAGDSPAKSSPDGDGPAGRCPADGGSGGHQRPAGRPAAGGPAPGQGPGMDGSLAAAINLTIPLATLLGLAERPGEAAGLGAIDPALARELARQATGHPQTTWCITVTDQQGHATGHGCARTTPRTSPANKPGRNKPGPTDTPGPRSTPGPNRPGPGAGPGPGKPGPQGTPGPGGPGPTDTPGPRTALGPAKPGPRSTPGPASTPGPDGPGRFSFSREQGPGPPGGYGRWRLRPGGDRDLLADLEPLAVTDCDHRHESAGYQPSDTLRHLIHIRDGDCSWPPCRRTARRCDFEHAIPWDQGGRSCACNGGPHCRHHHHQKQDPGWTVEQPQPGYRVWTTPAGRQYCAGPTEYPI